MRNHHFSFTPIASFPNYLVISFSCACMHVCVCVHVGTYILTHVVYIYMYMCVWHTYIYKDTY